VRSSNLTKEQRKLLVAWAAEGFDLREINDRAGKYDPPFTVEENQLKHVRARAAKNFRALREEFERNALAEGLAKRAVRLREKMERHALLKQVTAERAGHVEMQDAPGGKTGLLALDYKGKDADRAVYKLDAALLKEMRDLEREIAIELGQWTEKKELTGAGGEPLLDPLVAALEKAYGGGKRQQTETD
jgi:hypothetical protein